jgi:mannose-1-phosphate guanylyltransferase
MERQGLTAVVLAAGVGSRLDPLSRQLPKPLVPFVNRPVMEHILALLKRHGITRTVSNLHYLPDKISNYFCKGTAFGIDMSFVEETELSGDAGGVRACREYVDDDTFLVIMGDLITDLDLTYVLTQHKDRCALATIALKQVEDVERFGVAQLNPDGTIARFQEKPSREEAISNLASTGVYVFDRQIFDYIPQDGMVGFGRDVFPMLVEKGLPVVGVEVWGYWSDVGTIAQYRSSSLDALEGLIDVQIVGEQFERGWIGSGSQISASARIDGALLLGCNSYIGDGVHIKGYAIIGDNCVIEREAQLQDMIIWPGTILGARAHGRGSVIGANCHIPAGVKVLDTAVIEPANGLGPERMQRYAQQLGMRHTEPLTHLLVDPDKQNRNLHA